MPIEPKEHSTRDKTKTQSRVTRSNTGNLKIVNSISIKCKGIYLTIKEEESNSKQRVSNILVKNKENMEIIN